MKVALALLLNNKSFNGAERHTDQDQKRSYDLQPRIAIGSKISINVLQYFVIDRY